VHPVSTETQRRVEDVTFWFHSIDVGEGVVTPGQKSADVLRGELDSLDLPPLAGKSVLDIGAWDGYFSFAAEERGAARVVALDHYVWQFDLYAWTLSPEEQQEWLRSHGVDPGGPPLQPDQLPGVYRPEELPGMEGFTTARSLRDSAVEPVVADFMETDLDALGTFDVVLYLGVLYHIRDPFLALRRLREVTREVAIVETSIMAVPGYEEYALWQFFEGVELDHDPTNWWQPNAAGLEAGLLGAGFSRVERKVGPPPPEQVGGSEPQQYRAVTHAYP
jgi:tRNA (mo5U34)-methyltransferase